MCVQVIILIILRQFFLIRDYFYLHLTPVSLIYRHPQLNEHVLAAHLPRTPQVTDVFILQCLWCHCQLHQLLQGKIAPMKLSVRVIAGLSKVAVVIFLSDVDHDTGK